MSLDAQLLDVIQSAFPLVQDPYAALGAQLGASRADIVRSMAALVEGGAVRRVGASFASKELGYVSTLCAAAVEDERVEQAVRVINSYPGVTHNYRRDNRYNVWFTLIARGRSEVDSIVGQIAAEAGCGDILNLPARRLFKIRVDFAHEGERAPTDGADDACGPEPVPFDASDQVDVAIVRWAQGNIVAGADGVLLDRPFARGAELVNASVGSGSIDELGLIGRLQDLRRLRVVRRFGAMVRHRELGYSHNGMAVWNVDDADVASCGAAFAQSAWVSHCYERPRAASWPYNLYAMVHARSQSELDGHVAELLRACPQAGEPLVLVSTREYKKTSMRYFEEGV